MNLLLYFGAYRLKPHIENVQVMQITKCRDLQNQERESGCGKRARKLEFFSYQETWIPEANTQCFRNPL